MTDKQYLFAKGAPRRYDTEVTKGRTLMHFVRACNLSTKQLEWVSATSGTNWIGDAVQIARHGRAASRN